MSTPPHTRLTRRVPQPDPADHGVERIPWALLGPDFIRTWGRRGGKSEPEHLTVYGPTGSGKSYFIVYVIRQRVLARNSAAVYVATKRTDATISGSGWKVIDSWPPGYKENPVIFWAKAKGISAAHRVPQQVKVRGLMDKLWQPGSNIIVVWDELPYIEGALKLKLEMETFYREGRSYGITNVAGLQRPSGVSRLAHSENGWTVAFRPKDADDRDRVAEVLGDRQRFRLVLNDLNRAKREFVIRDEISGKVFISSLPAPRRPRPQGYRRRAVSGGYGGRVASRAA